MGLQLHDNLLQLLVVVVGDVVLPLEPGLLGFQLLVFAHFVVGLQGIKDGRPHQQVSERADDQGEGPHVLPLHGRQEGPTEGTMSPPGRPEIRQGATEAAAERGELQAAPGGARWASSRKLLSLVLKARWRRLLGLLPPLLLLWLLLLLSASRIGLL